MPFIKAPQTISTLFFYKYIPPFPNIIGLPSHIGVPQLRELIRDFPLNGDSFKRVWFENNHQPAAVKHATGEP